MTKLVHHAAAAVAAVLITTAAFAPVVAIPKADAASAIALPSLA